MAKALARAGVASRREVERLIEAGRVALNGQVLTTPAIKVEAGDILTVDGEVVNDREPARLFRYHKPAGLVTTHADPAGRSTVFEALPDGLPRLISVGRLDLNTEGLLLLTNDGALARALELPSTGLQRRYRARAHGRITQDKLDGLKHGVTVEGVNYGPIEARIDKAREGAQGANVWISLTLTEGKNREVRRVLESLGLQVNRLIRLAYGPLALGVLEAGEIEEVGPRVLREQFAGFIAPEDMPKGDRPAYSPPKRNRSAGAARRASAEVERVEAKPEVKKSYKPGWAKAKVSVRPKGAPKARPAPKVSGRDAALAEGRVMLNKARVQAARAAAAANADRPDRPDRTDRPSPERPAPERPRGARLAADRAGGDRPRPDRAKPAAARSQGARPEGARPDGAKSERPRASSPRPQGGKGERPSSDRPRAAGPGAPRPGPAPGKAQPGGKSPSERRTTSGDKRPRPAGPPRGGPRPGGPSRGSGGPRGPKSRG